MELSKLISKISHGFVQLIEIFVSFMTLIITLLTKPASELLTNFTPHTCSNSLFGQHGQDLRTAETVATVNESLQDG